VVSTLYAFGDSFTLGDQDDFLEESKSSPSHQMSYDERVEFLKYNVSFTSHIAKEINVNLKNFAVRGSGNFPQLDKLWQNVKNNSITKDDIVFFGFSSWYRDRLSIADHKRVYSFDFGPCMIDKELFKTHELHCIQIIDLFQILSSLKCLQSFVGFKLVCLQMFDALEYRQDCFDLFSQFNFYIEGGRPGFTSIDILNDTWSQNIKYEGNHVKIEPPGQYQHLYTVNRHPSILGHKKISDFLLNYFK
jgi:hypothetical protein